ncbi:MAG TPA: PQQ-binding-like beta-propeller repeat protein [Kofleriaceae bacterium]|nr:PQQ-binding-like beta-propeller repeat protein [Kofleriaceae bacterium]
MRTSWLALLLAACAAETSVSTDELTRSDAWPQLGFGPAHTSANPNETLLDVTNVAGLQLAWASTTGLRPGGVSVASGRAYVGSENNTLYAFDAVTGRRVWRAFAGNDIFDTPAAAYGHVYVISNDGWLYAAASRTGVVEWKADVHPYATAPIDTARFSPTVYNGMIYVAIGSRLFAFSASGCGAATCQPAWYADLPIIVGSWQTAPAIGKGNVYVVGATPGNGSAIDLYAFSLAGCASSPCTPAWVTTLPADYPTYVVPYGLVYHGGRIYLATNAALYSTYADTGVRRWHRNLPCLGAPAITGGVVYQPTSDGLVALEEANVGRTIWQSPPAAGPAFTAAVANGVVYSSLGTDQRLSAFAVGCGSAGATCEPIWADDVGGSKQPPVIVGGMVFVGNDTTHELRALSL